MLLRSQTADVLTVCGGLPASTLASKPVRLVFLTSWWTLPKMADPLLLVLLTSFGLCNGLMTSQYDCPDRCRCAHVTVNCSNRGLQEIPTDIDPDTVYLDLSGNQIQVIRKASFDRLRHLEVLLLNDNHVRTIEANAFKDLHNIRKLDLRRNKLTELGANSLAWIRASSDCSTQDPCSIDLRENPLSSVNSYAMSWCIGLSLLLGNSNTDLVIKAYAFYGAENIPEIRISQAPSVRLEHRIFTNTDSVRILEISNTEVKKIEKFTFEGLKNVAAIHLRNIRFGQIEEFGFSGILYSPTERSQLTAAYQETSPAAGGEFNISGSTIPVLPSDGFRDTNLRRLVLTGNQIGVIQGHAFRGLHSLYSLELTANTVDTVRPYAFGALNNVPRVELQENGLSELVERAFAESRGIRRLSLRVRHHSNMSLGSYSFSGLRDIRTLEIQGAPGSTFVVQKDAFHDLGGVDTFRIRNVSLPTLGEHTFRGLSKVQILKLEYCNISRIDGMAFGTTPGSVTVIELSEGNSLPCDCNMSRLLRDFESRFARFTVTCLTADAGIKVLTQDSSDWPTCDTNAAAGLRILAAISWFWLILSQCSLLAFWNL